MWGDRHFSWSTNLVLRWESFWGEYPEFCWWGFRWIEATGPPGPTSSCDSHSFHQREAKGNHSFSLGLWKKGISTIYPR